MSAELDKVLDITISEFPVVVELPKAVVDTLFGNPEALPVVL